MSKKILNSPLEAFTRKMFTRVIEALAQYLSEHPLSLSQVAALHIIDVTGTLSIQELAGRINLSISATSRSVDDLVKKGLVERHEDANNRRVKLISLTKSGKKILDDMSIERVKIVRAMAEQLPKIVSEKFLNSLSGQK